jgi:hypothetical protein
MRRANFRSIAAEIAVAQSSHMMKTILGGFVLAAKAEAAIAAVVEDKNVRRVIVFRRTL